MLIDRDLLQHILKKHLELHIETGAYRALVYTAVIGKVEAAVKFAEALQAEQDALRVREGGVYLALEDALSRQDDDYALSLLSSLFPRHS